MTDQDTLYMGIELSAKKWKFCFSDGAKERLVTVNAWDQSGTLEQIEIAKQKLNLAADCKVRSCYEAGRDAFWIHRFLSKHGFENVVVDSASIEVSRRRKHAKNDRLDAGKLVNMLYRYWVMNETRMWKVVHVPSEEAEDDRQLHRDISRLKKEINQHRTRMKAILVKLGIAVKQPESADMSKLVDWEGKALPDDTCKLLKMEQQRLTVAIEQLNKLEEIRNSRLEKPSGESDGKAQKMKKLRSIGAVTSWMLVKEFFGWREFANREEVGALAGLTGTPYDSGECSKEQGISKAGNAWVRTLMIEAAWSWLRYQPNSYLAEWYQERFGHGSKRMRRVGIVALARKLLIALWKYVEFDEIPEGAVLKTN